MRQRRLTNIPAYLDKIVDRQDYITPRTHVTQNTQILEQSNMYGEEQDFVSEGLSSKMLLQSQN